MPDTVRPNRQVSRRGFVKAAGAIGVSLTSAGAALAREPEVPGVAMSAPPGGSESVAKTIAYPRRFTGRNLDRISFPLGGIGTGSIGLGGRGNLQDWEIFNHPDNGRILDFAFPAIWVKTGAQPPVARVLERKLFPPYDITPTMVPGATMPGLPRLDEAVFHGSFPVAKIAFQDARLPVGVQLEAFSSMRPVDLDACSIPAAILEYTVTNPGPHAAEVVIAWSANSPTVGDKRVKGARHPGGMRGVLMTDTTHGDDHPMHGSFVLAAMPASDGVASVEPRWDSDDWIVGKGRFWHDYFMPFGDIGSKSSVQGISMTSSVSIRHTIPAGGRQIFRFLFAWHYPNRTTGAMGWSKGYEEDLHVGNFYTTRFKDAWDVATYTEAHLEEIAAATRGFAEAIASSTLPPTVLDAASANLSTMCSQTVMRIADGSIHTFEGCGDTVGWGEGNCTHVWNYEAVTPFVYPAAARSMRETSFTLALHEAGNQDFRHGFPGLPSDDPGPAVDGQMGQIVKLYQDFRFSGDEAWLRSLWPACKRAMSFAWVPDGWDPGARGILDGMAHNTYDIEFYGPNPLSQTYYIAALKACVEMANVVGDTEFAVKCAALCKTGIDWMEANLFNGSFYIQKPAAGFREQPKFQMGEGCLIDQLMGVYLSELAGLGSLLDEKNIRKTLLSIQQYNYRADMYDEPSPLRCFAYPDQAALVMCDYTHGVRPQDPFPYYSENWTGSEYAVAAMMMRYGMVREGVQAFANVRARFDGEHANPYSEMEWGRHYARPMSSWSGIVMLSGFRYNAIERMVSFAPLWHRPDFRCVWTASTGWGMVGQTATTFSLAIEHGVLSVSRLRLPRASFGGAAGSVKLGGKTVVATSQAEGDSIVLTFAEPITIVRDQPLTVHR